MSPTKKPTIRQFFVAVAIVVGLYHVTMGFLQGTGFALAGVIVGLVTTMVLHHTTGFLAGVAVFAWLFVRVKKRNRNPRYLEPRPPRSRAEDR